MDEYLPYVFIAIGIAVLVFLSFLAFRAARSVSWNAVSGVLLTKGTRLHIARDKEAEIVNWKSLHIDFEYAYEVEGVEYVANRVTFCDMVNKPMSSLDKILDQYLETEIVTVYYNPRDHGDSVLLPGVKVWNFTPMVTGLVSIALSVFWLYHPI